MTPRFVCLHGHFYQPPREDPWTGDVPNEISAAPFHDWNVRIDHECYQANCRARILDQAGHVSDVLNNFSRISFNIGPTLVAWMKTHAPSTLAAIIEADHVSRIVHGGFGNAIAQAYNHIIMPLASPQTQRTQIAWGIADFRHHFGRPPLGMWLPETAVCNQTLALLAECGIQFTILAPGQAQRIRALDSDTWHPVSVDTLDTSVPYTVHPTSTTSITVFFYDGRLAHQVAFGGLLNNGDTFAEALRSGLARPHRSGTLIHVATDGETYGHHHRFGEMALAYALRKIETHSNTRLTNYSEYMQSHPPEREVQIIENSSWSCAHGIERWRTDCGCKTGGDPAWNQRWRAPLREGIEFLFSQVEELGRRFAKPLFHDHDLARDTATWLWLDRGAHRVPHLQQHLRNPTHDNVTLATDFLTLEYQAMLMLTSCGWFFDDLLDLGSQQVLRYATRVLQMAETLDPQSTRRHQFLNIVERACSNRGSTARELVEAWSGEHS